MTMASDLYNQLLGKLKTLEPGTNEFIETLLELCGAPAKTVQTKWHDLNILIGGGLRPGFCSLLFGPPGNAKSFVAVNQVVYMLAEGRLDPLYIPLEYSQADHAMRAIGVIMDDWGFLSERADKKRRFYDWVVEHQGENGWVKRIENSIHQNPNKASKDADGNLVLPSTNYKTVLEIIAKEAQHRDLIIIDPVSAIEPVGGTKMSQTEQESRFVRNCKALAEEHNTHIMFISHSGRRQTHKGKHVPLSMDSIAGSIGWTRFCQYVFILDFDKSVSTSTVIGEHGMKESVEHTRTLIIDKLNYGKGAGQKIAMEFGHGPDILALGVIEQEQ